MEAGQIDQIEATVGRVWLRGLYVRAAGAVGWGMLAAAALWGIAAALHRWWEPVVAPGWAIALVGAAVTASVFIAGFLTRIEAARVLDARLQLKDRVVSALDFGRRARRDGIYALQIADAADHVRTVSVEQVVPWKWRRDAALIASALVIWAIGHYTHSTLDAAAVAVPPAPELVQDQALLLSEQFEELAEQVEAEGQDQLGQQLRRLQKSARSMSEPGNQIEDALATMGRMRTELMQAAAGLDVGANDALWKAYAEALQAVPLTQAAGQALARQDYRKAAAQFEHLANQADNPTQPFHEQAKGLEPEAARLAQQAKEAGSPQLGDSLQQMSRGIQQQDAGSCRSALNQQASECRSQAARKSVANRLRQQLSQLSQSRQSLAESSCSAARQPGGQQSPSGSGQGFNFDSMAADQASTSPSQSAGLGEHSDPFGEVSDLAGVLEEKQVSGSMNRGPSEFTVEEGPAFEQSATRGYADIYSRYRKLSDEVIEQEALPAGYQAIIRRYFEGIRPLPEEAGVAADRAGTPEGLRRTGAATDGRGATDARPF